MRGVGPSNAWELEGRAEELIESFLLIYYSADSKVVLSLPWMLLARTDYFSAFL